VLRSRPSTFAEIAAARDRAGLLQEVWIDVFWQLRLQEAVPARGFTRSPAARAIELRRNGRPPPAAEMPELIAARKTRRNFPLRRCAFAASAVAR
jgi:hypothetical protein